MHRLSVRIGVLVLGVAVTAVLGYRAYQDDQALDKVHANAARLTAMSAEASATLAELRASLHAYVAPGQNLPFWARKAQTGLDTLREQLLALDTFDTADGGPFAESIDGVKQLKAAESRARTHVSRDESLLAGDVIFTEGRDLMAAVSRQLADVTRADAANFDRRAASLRAEQQWLAAAAVGLWLLVAVTLAPPVTKTAVTDPAQWRHDLKNSLEKATTVAPATAIAPLGAPADLPLVTPAEADPVATNVQVEPTVSLTTVQEVADICAELSTLADPEALQHALERANALLDARGLIVWVAAADAQTLSPVAVSGFDPKLLSRIGSIPRESANLTAAAFRQTAPKTAEATSGSPGAIAVALCGPSGPTGVLSVELKPGEAVDEAKVALASIVAAQLATLATPTDAAAPAVEERTRAAS